MKHSGFLLLLLVSACHREPSLSADVVKAIRADVPGITDACLDKIGQGGVAAMPDTEHCESMTAERHWSGLWRHLFEDSRFCEAPAKECDERTVGTWVTLEMKTAPIDFIKTPPGGLYAVQLIGRETLYPDRLEGRPKKRLVVHRFVSFRQVEAPPK